jgi:ribosome-associated heat shock protein Hsp15
MTGRVPVGAPADERMRLDKWLWVARFLKSRTQASALCEAGRVRLNGTPCLKAHQSVRPGDVLTFPLGLDVRVVRVCGLAPRRLSAPLARTLYQELKTP